MPLSAFNTHIIQLQPDRSVYSFLENAEDALKFHQSLHQYYPTPLHSLPGLANMIGVGNIRVKDESYRFGLNAFKGLGGSYAMFRFIKKLYEKKQNRLFEAPMLWDNTVMASLNLPVFCTATDGNHGRGVAWFAELIGANAVVYAVEDRTPRL